MIIQLKRIGVPDENSLIYSAESFREVIKSTATTPIAGKIGVEGLGPLGKIIPPYHLSHTFMNLRAKMVCDDLWLIGELIILFSPLGEELRNLILNDRAFFVMAGEVNLTSVEGTASKFVENCWLNSINAVKLDPV